MNIVTVPYSTRPGAPVNDWGGETSEADSKSETRKSSLLVPTKHDTPTHSGGGGDAGSAKLPPDDVQESPGDAKAPSSGAGTSADGVKTPPEGAGVSAAVRTAPAAAAGRRGSRARRQTLHAPDGWTQQDERPRFRYRRRSSGRGRRRRRRKSHAADEDKSASERYRSSFATVRAALHWRWMAHEERHLTLGGAPEPELPAELQQRPPAHSRWLWNSKRGDLHWRSAPKNPVEEFYSASLSDDAIKKELGLFGRRYTKYPNEATWARPEDGKGIFARARSKVVDREGRVPPASQTVTIEDVKRVAETAVGQFFPTAYGRRRFSQIPTINQFLLSIVEYFHHYFQDRKLVELAKQTDCLVFDTAGRAARSRRLRDCQLEAARCYAKFILGRDVPFHHTNRGAFGTISASAADRQFWEALYAFTVQVVWITFGRPDVTVIVRETGRLFRTLYFDPARREGPAPVYKTGDQRRNAALGLSPPRDKHQAPTRAATNAIELAAQNYLAMCVAIGRVYGEYDCPPMPPKPIYGLLNNRSALMNLLLAEDPNEAAAGGQHAVDRAAIGILGHPRRLFDDSLEPIDEPREGKFARLKFLGPISERAQRTRITAVTPSLLQPTPPSVSDLEKFT